MTAIMVGREGKSPIVAHVDQCPKDADRIDIFLARPPFRFQASSFKPQASGLPVHSARLRQVCLHSNLDDQTIIPLGHLSLLIPRSRSENSR